jgi:hypothetical protein
VKSIVLNIVLFRKVIFYTLASFPIKKVPCVTEGFVMNVKILKAWFESFSVELNLKRKTSEKKTFILIIHKIDNS